MDAENIVIQAVGLAVIGLIILVGLFALGGFMKKDP